MANPYQSQMNQYKRMKFETASPEMLILMLYDGAIKNIIQAQSMIYDKNQIEVCSNALIKAQNIITELMVSLNFDIGGDIAKNLFNIYEYVNYTLAQANINKNDDNLEVVLQMLKDLRGTWQEVIKINKEKYPDGIPEPAAPPKSEAAPKLSPGPAPATIAAQPAPAAPPAPSPAPISETQAETPIQRSAETPETPASKPIAQPGTPAQPAAKTPTAANAQTNRFKQIYGKNIPRKV
jgi:flagellar secretion chaperone FliS